MAETAGGGQAFNILAVVQEGRLAYEALLLMASLRAANPGFRGKVFLAEPQPGKRWHRDPRLQSDPIRAMLESLGATFLPFENKIFGQSYPHGNKIEALAALPDEPFLFLDTDTLVLGDLQGVPFDFARPSASMRREGSWPEPQLYHGGYGEIWKSLYDRFGLDFASSLDFAQPDDYWQRYLYFNAGWFFHQSPRAFGERFLTFARTIRDAPPDALAAQSLDPWLDQVALPLVIHSFGGGRPGPELAGLDGSVTCHYRSLPLLYARESDRVVEVLEEVAGQKDLRRLLRDHEPARLMIYQNRGRKARALFDRDDLPRREQTLRSALKKAGLWLR
ncbi:hypothetical protein [Tabrizicola oligotrophica]|uniref:Uncharacterized protein n=1 Tax=Tabrizicola oligotrophica TaxID=2710650 RepID=A0A6M0QRY2_9RHOB|nr:hypothetical protein [Tabrizicola oligotrophica]NEY89403.1 hypothetical protein [Tabrizicola oligotrophica]